MGLHTLFFLFFSRSLQILAQPAMLDSCQLGQEQHVCCPQITRLPPASQKAPALPWCQTLQEHQLLLTGPQKQSAVQLACGCILGSNAAAPRPCAGGHGSAKETWSVAGADTDYVAHRLLHNTANVVSSWT